VAGSCGGGNEPLGSIKCREFLDYLLASGEGLCSVQLVSKGITTDLRAVSCEFLTKFIEMYHENPCLWKVK
jgi:hypothetical protein